MKQSNISKHTLLLFMLLICMSIFAQIKQGVYLLEDGNIRHELKLNSHYFIHTVYEKSPAEFIKSVGGFYTIQKNTIKVILEFNSAFQKDSLRTLNMPILVKEGNLILGDESKMIFKPQESNTQDLDGQWLFATRGPDKGQERRGESNTRKTLKFLKDGYFQWIAYNTESMQFKGTGGGSYTSLDGIYTEHIEFFSRDNSRVEESLKFNYEIKGDDWHHTGKNSKDEPMYEIWGRRGLSE